MHFIGPPVFLRSRSHLEEEAASRTREIWSRSPFSLERGIKSHRRGAWVCSSQQHRLMQDSAGVVLNSLLGIRGRQPAVEKKPTTPWILAAACSKPRIIHTSANWAAPKSVFVWPPLSRLKCRVFRPVTERKWILVLLQKIRHDQLSKYLQIPERCSAEESGQALRSH